MPYNQEMREADRQHVVALRDRMDSITVRMGLIVQSRHFGDHRLYLSLSQEWHALSVEAEWWQRYHSIQ